MRRPSLLLCCTLLLPLCACKAQLYTSLSERDAMSMVSILREHGMAADRVIAKDGTSTIEVDDSRIAEAVALLRANRYPRTDYESLGDVFQQKGMISSPTAERARYVYGLTQELSRTLSDIDGVLTARVHVVLPQDDPLDSTGKPAAAAVFIRYDSRNAMDRLLPQIKLLVANSIEGLSYDKVSVVLLPVTLPAVAADMAPATARAAASGGKTLPASGGTTLPASGGWILAVAWPLGFGGWLLWRRRARAAGGGTAVPAPRLRRVA